MSVLKHSVLLLALWTGIIAYYMYHPLPDDLEEPWKVRLLLAGLKFTGHIAFASSKLGIATEHETMRWILNTAYVAGMKIDDPDLNIKTTEIEGVRVRIYEPVKGSAYGPAIVYFHGGGWTIMSIDTHDEFTRELARRTQFTVISVDYRLAPEHPFPAPFDDCFAVTRHLLEFGSQFKIDPSKIVVMGDDAGGNLAAAVAQKFMRTPRGLPSLRLQVLLTPMLQAFDFRLPSYARNERRPVGASTRGVARAWLGYMRKDPAIAWFFARNNHTSRYLKTTYSYLVDFAILPPAHRRDYARDRVGIVDAGDETLSDAMQNFVLHPYFAPLMQKTLKGLPPAYVVAAGYDVVADDAVIYARRLRKDGVVTTLKYYERGFHQDVLRFGNFAAGARTFNDLIAFLKQMFEMKTEKS
ncbi:neutral cholesterol ester hydrolase 1-like isoform X1 [Tubulanus polymorphus]|uniref:neutral cholesterol ester hydrolase 1-like isoform X1 n=1 Tax=Tubulanus polymorphus TaxID=672921 RepID=UPI003DA3A7C9